MQPQQTVPGLHSASLTSYQQMEMCIVVQILLLCIPQRVKC